MDTTILEDLGLSKGEVKIYLALLSIGQTKVGQIIEKSTMASSAVHNSLNTLIEKGLISYTKMGKIKFYSAVPAKQLINFIEDKKKKILEILPELESRQKQEEKEEAEIFEGTKGIKTMLNLLIENCKKHDEYLFFSNDVQERNKEIQDFFIEYDIKRKEKGIIIMGLAPKELKNLFVKRKFLKMKYTPSPMPSNVSICNDKVALFTWGEKPIGYLISSKQIFKMYRELFDQLWKLAKL
jgi:sugar-specific transcriptional regulator TrmB